MTSGHGRSFLFYGCQPAICEVCMNIWLTASLWVGLALIAAMVSIRAGVSVALTEIAVGVLAGNFLHLAPSH
jgi:Kef-type K+ transport system membrane component KefB